MLEFTVNSTAFNQLPSDLQAIVRYAARAANQNMLDEFTARNNESLQQLLAAGTQLRALPEDILSLLYEKSLDAMATLRASDFMAEKIAVSYDAFSKNVRAYHEISERAYLNARDKVLPRVMPEVDQAEPGR
jgi:TRAP-type mannitol/chloroaromatic compound transport system substrate-binding protein